MGPSSSWFGKKKMNLHKSSAQLLICAIFFSLIRDNLVTLIKRAAQDAEMKAPGANVFCGG